MSREALISEIMRSEGWPKFTDAPHDRGGPTKGGITLLTLSRFFGRPATLTELKELPEATARLIYERLFIIWPGFEQILDEQLRHYVVDIGVTSGTTRAIRYLQRQVGAKDDGYFGPVTAIAVNGADPVKLLHRLIAYRATKMAADVQDNPDQLKWIEGWIARAVKPLLA